MQMRIEEDNYHKYSAVQNARRDRDRKHFTSRLLMRTLQTRCQQCRKRRDSSNDDILVTDLVPSEMACLASSPGRMSRTDVWISRDEMVDFLE